VVLLILAICNITFQHHGERFDTALRGGQPCVQVRVLAAASIIWWLSILIAWRWIGFA
jgi:hypothetical protein